MNNKKQNNLTINIYADDQLRSSNMKNHRTKIESSSIHVLYPTISDVNNTPSVPICYKQGIINKNLDRKIEAIFV
jgi:hypothetical protein